MLKRVMRKIGYEVFDIQKNSYPQSTSVEFGVKKGYRHRLKNDFFDATAGSGNWQREVYQAAAQEALDINANLIYDIGCGSAKNLIEYFSELTTVGFDMEPTVKWLKSRYPDRQWQVSSFCNPIKGPADIVICADVIEHIPNPDELMSFLSSLSFKKLFLSTPERSIAYGFDHSGPPKNLAHCREWTLEEFKNYAMRYFKIESHYISNFSQATQLVIASKFSDL